MSQKRLLGQSRSCSIGRVSNPLLPSGLSGFVLPPGTAPRSIGAKAVSAHAKSGQVGHLLCCHIQKSLMLRLFNQVRVKYAKCTCERIDMRAEHPGHFLPSAEHSSNGLRARRAGGAEARDKTWCLLVTGDRLLDLFWEATFAWSEMHLFINGLLRGLVSVSIASNACKGNKWYIPKMLRQSQDLHMKNVNIFI